MQAKKRSSRFQVIGLLLFLLSLMLIAMLTTLLVTGTISPPDIIGGGQPMGSIVDAEDVCTKRLRGEYNNTLRSMTVDDYSSRYDSSNDQYKMFYQLEVYRDASRRSGIDVYYINCFISADRGRVVNMEYLKEDEFKSKALRRTQGNAFGL